MSKNTFNFVMPAELEKAKDGNWKIKGLASTGGIDQQGETIIQKGMDLSPIDQKRAVLNWDHQAGVENIVGVLDGYSQGNQGLYVEGRLFKNHTKAKSIQEIMTSLGEEDKGRMGLSVEGSILERDPQNPKVIKKCRINAVALTMKPVNSGTYVDLVKSMPSELEFDSTEERILSKNNSKIEENQQPMFTSDQVLDIVRKALGVGAGYLKAPNELTDGDSMTTSDMKAPKKKKKGKSQDPVIIEDLEDKPKKKLKKATSELYKSLMLTMLDNLQKLYPDHNRSEIWAAVQDRIETRFPNIYSAKEEQ